MSELVQTSASDQVPTSPPCALADVVHCHQALPHPPTHSLWACVVVASVYKSGILSFFGGGVRLLAPLDDDNFSTEKPKGRKQQKRGKMDGEEWCLFRQLVSCPGRAGGGESLASGQARIPHHHHHTHTHLPSPPLSNVLHSNFFIFPRFSLASFSGPVFRALSFLTPSLFFFVVREALC